MILENRLFHSNKIEVRKSKIDGYGVFAKENLKKNELLEECHYIEVGREGGGVEASGGASWSGGDDEDPRF